MPLFEYECSSCHKVSVHLVGMIQAPGELACDHCGSNGLEKKVSRFRRGRSESARYDELADQIDGMGEPSSGAATRELVREMGRAADDDFSDDLEERFEAEMEGLGTDE